MCLSENAFANIETLPPLTKGPKRGWHVKIWFRLKQQKEVMLYNDSLSVNDSNA